MKFLRTAVRREEEIANDFAQLIEEGRALLGEMLDKPARKATRDVLEQATEKLADYQTSAIRMAQQGAKRGGKYARQADQYVRDNPWPVVAGGIAIGVLASLWWSQRR
jgi:ElaB/YqjD/DUF883 family membrane-anchored ribosome-binding protein